MINHTTPSDASGPSRSGKTNGLFAAACALGALALTAGSAFAQLSPDRLYYGKDRAIPMTVERPTGEEGELTIRRIEPESDRVIESAEVAEGGVDLASLFPLLWQQRRLPLSYAQLYVGDVPVGPAVVLQPLLNPPQAVANGREIAFNAMGGTFSGIRAYVDQNIVLETNHGEIILRMRPDQAPNTVWNFRHLVDGGYYTDVIFHRIIGERPGRPPFVIQGGDLTGTGTGDPGYKIDLERSAIPHDFGVISMARSQAPDTGGSQFFICLSREGTASLDGGYTSYGYAVTGAEVIEEIGRVEVGSRDRPESPEPRIIRAYLTDSAPYPNRAPAVTRPGVSPTR